MINAIHLISGFVCNDKQRTRNLQNVVHGCSLLYKGWSSFERRTLQFFFKQLAKLRLILELHVVRHDKVFRLE